MKIKKHLVIFMTFLMTTTVFAKATIHPSPSNNSEINHWKMETKDDGYFFILGQYTKKLLVININKNIANGKPADVVTVQCNAVNETSFREHRVVPGSSITCKGNFQDTSSMSIDPADFKNGADGIYEYIPVTQMK